MNAPAVARGSRRAFLAPVWVAAATAFVGVAVAATWFTTRGTTTIVIVRHAEKIAEGGADPGLAPEGLARAQRLASLLGAPDGLSRPEAIYVSDTLRSAQTAAPIAGRLGIVPIVVPRGDADATARSLLEGHSGGTTLVIAHSNTLPLLVRELTRGRYTPTVDEADFESLYVVSRPSVGPATLLHLRY